MCGPQQPHSPDFWGGGRSTTGPNTLQEKRETYPICPFRFLLVFCVLGASPAKENSKESDFWKMLPEPEEQPSERGAQAEVRASFLALSLRPLNMGFRSEGHSS